jgi:hypothetical protein
MFSSCHLPTKMEQTECSETSAYKIQTPGNYPEESIQHSEHGGSLISVLEVCKIIYPVGCSLQAHILKLATLICHLTPPSEPLVLGNGC